MAQIIDVTIPSSMNPSVKDAMQYVIEPLGLPRCARQRPVIVKHPLHPAAAGGSVQARPHDLRNTLQVLSGPSLAGKVDEVARQVLLRASPRLINFPDGRGPKPSSNCKRSPLPNSSGGSANSPPQKKSARWSRPSWSPRCQRRRRSQTSPAPTKKPESTTCSPQPHRPRMATPLLLPRLRHRSSPWPPP
ncbi:hypothetical protein AB2C82_29435 [Pseudomonas aeruginosa]